MVVRRRNNKKGTIMKKRRRGSEKITIVSITNYVLVLPTWDTLDFCCEGVTELQTLPVLMSLSLTPRPKSLTLDSLTTLWEY